MSRVVRITTAFAVGGSPVSPEETAMRMRRRIAFGLVLGLAAAGWVAIARSAHGRSSVAGGQPPWASARVFRDDVADERHGKEGRIIRVRPPSRSCGMSVRMRNLGSRMVDASVHLGRSKAP